MVEEEEDDDTQYQLVSGRICLGGNAVRRRPCRYGGETYFFQRSGVVLPAAAERHPPSWQIFNAVSQRHP